MRASIVPVVVASVSLTVLSGLVPGSVAHAAPECLAKPGAPPPQGKHWYYNTDRSKNRRCWYLGPEGRRARPDATRVASPETQPAARPQPAATAPAKPQRTIEAIVRDLNAEAPVSATVGESSPVGLSARESDQPVTQGAIDGASTPAREPVSDEPAKRDSEVAGTPPVWPVLPAAEPAATPPSATVEPPPAPLAAATPPSHPASEQPATPIESSAAATGTSWSLVFLAGMFVLAGFVGRAVYKRTAGLRFDRHHGLDRARVTPAAMAPTTSLESTFATEVGHWTDIARRQPLPTDRFEETEDAVRALMRASRVSRHEHAA